MRNTCIDVELLLLILLSLLFQVVVICLLSVFVSVFAKSSITPIEYAQQAKHTLERRNITLECFQANESGYVIQEGANYTGLKAKTFKDNTYGKPLISQIENAVFLQKSSSQEAKKPQKWLYSENITDNLTCTAIMDP